MTLRVLSNFLILSAMTLAAACGGGGGGGGGGSTPPPTGGGSTQVAITTGNAMLAAAVGNAFLEAYTQLTISSLDNVFDLIESGELSVGMVCDGFGASGRITLTDNDSNGEVSAGDQLVLQYNNCFQDSLGDVVIGRVNINVLSLTIGLDLSVAGESEGDLRRELDPPPFDPLCKGQLQYQSAQFYGIVDPPGNIESGMQRMICRHTEARGPIMDDRQSEPLRQCR